MDQSTINAMPAAAAAAAAAPVAFLGTLVHTPEPSPAAIADQPHPVQILTDHLLIVDGAGAIVHVGPAASASAALQAHQVPEERCHRLTATQFLLPGFIDTHIHAPQYSFTGTGTDLPLFDWLTRYTFPAEARLNDLDFARRLYADVVCRLLRLGTTTAAYFSTADVGACKVLADAVLARGQRALVGKVSMDQHAPDDAVRSCTEQELQDVLAVTSHVEALASPRVLPCVIPRFTATCSEQLLSGLGKLAQQLNLRVLSHIAESAEQVEISARLHPGAAHDAGVFDAAGLLKPGAALAHGTHLTEDQLALMAARGAGLAHCPLSNFYFGDGLLDVRRALRAGVAVGLGTDVAGGYSPSMLQAMRLALVNSHAVKAAALGGPGASSSRAAAAAGEAHALTWQQALWLATQGGAAVLGLQRVVGSLEVGKQLDALLVDVDVAEAFDCYADVDDKLRQLELFVHLGDDRNIRQVWVAGRHLQGFTHGLARGG